MRVFKVLSIDPSPPLSMKKPLAGKQQAAFFFCGLFVPKGLLTLMEYARAAPFLIAFPTALLMMTTLLRGCCGLA